MSINPSDVFSYLNRGKAKANTGDLKGAVADYDAGIARLQPPDPRAYMERAEIKQSLSDWRGAVADYDQALALAPGDPALIAKRNEAQSHVR